MGHPPAAELHLDYVLVYAEGLHAIIRLPDKAKQDVPQQASTRRISRNGPPLSASSTSAACV